MKNVKRIFYCALVIILSVMIFAEYSWSSSLLPWVRFSGTYQATAGIGTGSLTLNATVREMDYENGDVWKANIPGIETIYSSRIVLSGATRTGDYSFNGDPVNPDDVTFSIIATDGYVYLTSTLADIVFTQQGAIFVNLNQYLDANNPATLNLHNVILRPNGDDGLHPSRYLNELAAYLGSTNDSGLKMQLFVPSSGDFRTNSTGLISFGLLDGLKSLHAPSGLNASALSSSQLNISWTDNSNNETGFKIERKTGADGTYAEIASVGANIVTFSDTGLPPGITYYYRVKAYNSADSDYSNEANAATLTDGTWTGSGSDNLASNPDNWLGRLVPVNGDKVVFQSSVKNSTWDINISPSSLKMGAGYTGTITLNVPLAIKGNLTVASGALNLNHRDLNTDGYLWIETGGSLYATSSAITVKGDWINFGGFIPGTSTVILNGTNQAIYGNTTFYNLVKTVTIADTLYFQAGSAQTILNNLTLQGASGNLLSLRSTEDRQYWYLDLQGTRSISFVDMKDSYNTGSAVVIIINSIDSGNNTNTHFGEDCVCLEKLHSPQCFGEGERG